MATILEMRPGSGTGIGTGGAKLTSLPQLERGRGARSNPAPRYDQNTAEFVDDGWQSLAEVPRLKTEIFTEQPKTIISRNTSPDISFDRSINPYRGCEHGCVYCYARPSHAYMGLSPGLDFESKLFIKPNAAALLREELTATNYKPAVIALGANTDPYQPIERDYRITRQVIEVLREFNHPFGIVTKSANVLRDLDLLQPMAEKGLVKVAISVTTLDPALARSMEPRASTPMKRMAALELLSKAGIPTVVMIGPVIPGLNDSEIENILKAARNAGVKEAGYTMLRLPLEVKEVFKDWLEKDYPDRAAKVMSLVRSVRGGKENDPNFGTRMGGQGPYAWAIGRRFQLASERLGLNTARVKLRTDLFTKPPQKGEQMSLI
ncbi:PA0069 family radical SAM protein [Aestuariivirga litoralis]|uniref:PA0069 family radical SAM protein n=1 Tax=Aestuariivirga litoralis TaxID=2650924 RepID=UPI001FF05FC8|nr:PA0069 family radical SAM protein [Aestuariivirga litoralis]